MKESRRYRIKVQIQKYRIRMSEDTLNSIAKMISKIPDVKKKDEADTWEYRIYIAFHSHKVKINTSTLDNLLKDILGTLKKQPQMREISVSQLRVAQDRAVELMAKKYGRRNFI